MVTSVSLNDFNLKRRTEGTLLIVIHGLTATPDYAVPVRFTRKY
jgi:hypothetical protein